jgi:hypothetical protein
LTSSSATLIAFGPRRENWPENDLEFLLDIAVTSPAHFPHSGLEIAMTVPPPLWSKPSVATKLGKLLSRSDRYDIQHPILRDLILKTLDNNPTLDALLYPAALVTVAEESDARDKLKRIFSNVAPLKDETDNLYPKLASAIVRLIDCPDTERCVNQILDIAEESALLSMLLSGELLPIQNRLNTLTLIIKNLKERGSPKWREYVPIARKGLDSRKSDLTNSDIWNGKLEFPAESFGILLPPVAP